MRPISIAIVALGMAAAPVAAATTNVRISAFVPVSCSIDVMDVIPMKEGITLTIQRRCNTHHAVVISGSRDQTLDGVTVRYNENVVDMASAYRVIPQAARYFDGVDRMFVDMPAASSEQVRRFAASMRIGIETF